MLFAVLSCLLCATSAFQALPAARMAAAQRSVAQMQLSTNLKTKDITFDQDGIIDKKEVGSASKVRLLARIEELRVLSAVADAGLLSTAEANGVFSSLENAGAFSTIEGLLPIADDLKLLSTLEALINVPASTLTLAGVALLAGEAGLIVLVPDDSTALVAAQAVTGLLAGAGGLVLLGAGQFFSLLQSE